jgi:hypothetical protein
MKKPRSARELKTIGVRLIKEQKFLSEFPKSEALQVLQDLIRAIEDAKALGTVPTPSQCLQGRLLVLAIDDEIDLHRTSSLCYNKS